VKVVVTGSEGFIGRNLCKRLEAAGDEVYGMDTKSGTDMFGSFPRCDVIYHLACVNQEEAVIKPAANLKVNIEGARYAAMQAKYYGAHLVYTSTASVYGQSQHIATPVDAEINPKTDYAIAKLAGEHFVKTSGCNYSIVRLSNVYGPFQTTDNPYCGVIGKFITQALEGSPITVIGDGHQTRDYTYVDDVINILLGPLSMDNRTENISRGAEVSVNDLVTVLQDVLTQKLEVVNIPERVIDGISRRKLITNYRCPTNLYDGLSKTVEWYKQNGTPGKTG